MHELNSRQKISITILLLYVLPILILTAYSLIENGTVSWSLFSLGLLVSSAGALYFFFLFKRLEEETQNRVAELTTELSSLPVPMMDDIPPPQHIEEFKHDDSHLEVIESLQNKIHELEKIIDQSQVTLNARQDELQKNIKEKKELQRSLDLALDDLSNYKKSREKQYQQQEVLLQEYQSTIEDQRIALDKKDQHIHSMENRIRDLNYEIKTLLHIAELHTPSSHDSWNEPAPNEEFKLAEVEREEVFAELSDGVAIKSPGEAALLLKRCIESAQKIAGAYHFAKGSARFRDLSVDHYALELRRLFDSLREEMQGIVIVFSPKENKLLFVNQQVKNLLGWSPDKFTQDFFELLADGHFQWKNAISQMPPKIESQFQLVIKSKDHQDRRIHCHLGTIPFGIFKDLIIGILF